MNSSIRRSDVADTLKAYFTEELHIGHHEQLADLASEVGLEREKALDILRKNDFSEEVRRDEFIARQIGITGVPFFLFNQTYAVSGAQSSDVFLDVLKKVWEEQDVSG